MKRKIQAAASPDLKAFALDCVPTFDFSASEEGKPAKRPKFEMTAYSGGVMNVASYWNPVVIDLSGLRAKQRVPVLLDHDSKQIVGQSQKTEITAQTLKLSGVITGNTDGDGPAAAVVSHAKNDFEWQASVGVAVDRTEFVEAGVSVKVNGKTFQGPLTVVRAGRLNEVSFVAVGADEKTAVKVAASGAIKMDPKFKAWLEANGFDPEQVNEQQRPSLEAAWKASDAPKPSPSPANPPQADPVQAALAEGKRKQAIADVTATFLASHPTRSADIEAAALEAAADPKITPDAFELGLIRAMRPKVAPPVRQSDDTLNASVVEAALCASAGLKDIEKQFQAPVLEAAHKRWRGGLSVGELIVAAARANGYSGMGTLRSNLAEIMRAAFRPEVRAAGVSTLSIPGILSNVANKFIREAFMAVDQAWSQIAARKNVRDFKTATTYSLTGGLSYDEIAPGGEIKHGTLGEQTYTNAAKSYGKLLSIDRRDIINDDLDALSAAPRRLGRGAINKLNSIFWTAFMDNAAFFTAALGNYDDGADTALSHAALILAATLFLKQTDPDGQPLGIAPKILLTPSELSFEAERLLGSANLLQSANSAGTSGERNVFAGKYQSVSTPSLSNAAITGYSTTAWYLLADPADLAIIEVAFLNGNEMPTIETADANFDTLGIQMRGYHDFGVAKQEYRAGVKMKGVV